VEGAYNPMNLLPMVQECVERCLACGTPSDVGAAFAAKMGWQLA
jgi:hypothetical protein